MLFHYHFWTPNVEETENFYVQHGFRISQRVGKFAREFQSFDPPLTWNDFREKNILFRIIEARKGAVNITFGYGMRIMFDHIGFSVTENEHHEICERAEKMTWEVKRGERRTFISTPYAFKIELQMNTDVIDSMTDDTHIKKMIVATKKKGLEDDLAILFRKPVKEISSEVGSEVTIKEANITGLPFSNVVDPNGVRISDK